MTLIVGIRCQDGIVIGSDSASTSTASGVDTVSSNLEKKVNIIGNRIITAGSGSVGLAQRFKTTMEERLGDKKTTVNQTAIEVGKYISSVVISDFRSTHLNTVDFSALVALPCKDGHALIEFAPGNFQPEVKRKRNWYVSIGAGQQVADPLLEFFRHVFWGDEAPNLRDGIFAAMMILRIGCEIAPRGVSKPIQMATLDLSKKGNYTVTKFQDEDILEHDGIINDAIDYFKEYRRGLENKDPAAFPSFPNQS